MPIGDWELRFTIRDSEGHTGDTVLNLDSSLEAGDLAGIAVAFAPILAGMLDGVVASITGVKLFDLSASLPSVETNVEQAARFIWRVDDTAKTMLQTLPTFKSSLITAGSNLVNLSAAPVTAFINAMTNAGIGAEIGANPEANAPRDSENRLLGTVKTATEWWGKLRKMRG